MMAANLLDNPNDVGMLSLGLRLLSTPGKFGQALGTAGLGAMGDMEQAKQAQAMAQQRALQQQIQMMQVEDVRRKQAQAAADASRKARDDSILQSAFQPMAGPMPDGAAGVPTRFDMQGMMARGLSMDSVPEALKLQAALNPPRKLRDVAPGATVIDENDPSKVVFSAPSKPDEDKNVTLLKLIHGDGTPAFISALRKLGDKMTTHAPASQAIAYASPVPYMLPNGQVGYAQPGNRPGAPPQLMNDPNTGAPLVKPPGPEKDPTEGERKAATLLQRLRSSQKQLSDTLAATPSAAKPGTGAEAARKVFGDTAANVMTPASRQQVEAAQLDILDAALTLGTGAAYTKEQLEGYRRSYFPQIGDEPPSVADKTARLKNVIDAAEIAAGRAAKDVPKFSGGGPAKITGDADYKALPSGATFVGPDGKIRRKP